MPTNCDQAVIILIEYFVESQETLILENMMLWIMIIQNIQGIFE